MRRIILLSTVLFATPFGIDCYAEDCVNSNCQTLGYTYPTNIGGCLQCPFGNYWFCPGNDDYCPNLGTLDSCPKGYKCEYEECSGKYYKVDGCQDSYVWDANAKTCTCPNLGTLDSCPKGYKCVYEACSGKYYKVDGCQDSYVWDANAKTCTCPNKGNLSSCPTGYKCVYEACSGKYYKVDGCASGYDWNASSKTCTCPNKGNLSSCPTGYDCNYESCSGKYYKTGNCSIGFDQQGSECICKNRCSLSSCPTGGICEQETCSKKYCLNSCKTSDDYELKNGTCVCKTVANSFNSCPSDRAYCAKIICSGKYYITGCLNGDGYGWNSDKSDCIDRCAGVETLSEYRTTNIPNVQVFQCSSSSSNSWKFPLIYEYRCPFTGRTTTHPYKFNVIYEGSAGYSSSYKTQDECEQARKSYSDSFRTVGENTSATMKYRYCRKDGKFYQYSICKYPDSSGPSNPSEVGK